MLPIRAVIPVEADQVDKIKDQWNRLKDEYLLCGFLVLTNKDQGIAKHLQDHFRDFHEMSGSLNDILYRRTTRQEKEKGDGTEKR